MESTASSDVIFSTNHWTAHKELDIIDYEGDIYAALKNCPFEGILVEMTCIKTDSNVHWCLSTTHPTCKAFWHKLL